MSRFAAVVVALLCSTALFVGVIGATDGNYDIQIDGSVDTPPREVTLEGDEYTVSAIGVVAPGEAIDVSIDAPANTEYDLYLYNEDRRTEEIINDASASETFDGDYDAGSYMVAIWVDGQVKAVHPVVVKSYSVTVDAPEDAEPGAEATFTVDVENVAGTSENLDSVQVVVSKDGNDETLTATEGSDGSYTATTTLSETGDYLVYANVRGSDTVNGQKELLGVSGSTEIAVQESTATPTATPTPDSGGEQNPSESTSTGTPTATVMPSPTEEPTPSDASTPTATATVEPTTTTTPTDTATPEPTATATPSNVVTPNDSTPSPTTTTTGSLSGVVPVLSVLGFALVVRRRRQ